jgi:hypothetical protein
MVNEGNFSRKVQEWVSSAPGSIMFTPIVILLVGGNSTLNTWIRNGHIVKYSQIV